MTPTSSIERRELVNLRGELLRNSTYVYTEIGGAVIRVISIDEVVRGIDSLLYPCLPTPTNKATVNEPTDK